MVTSPYNAAQIASVLFHSPLSYAKSKSPDQTPRVSASDLGLHCLLEHYALFKWVSEDVCTTCTESAVSCRWLCRFFGGTKVPGYKAIIEFCVH